MESDKYKTYVREVKLGKSNPRARDAAKEEMLLLESQTVKEYDLYMTEIGKLKAFEKGINAKYSSAKQKIYEYCESLMFPLYQLMTCVNISSSNFVSNRAVAGFSYFWGARHGRDPIPVCDDCEENVRKLLGSVIAPTVRCEKHNYDDRVICQGATSFYQVPDVTCSNCSAVAPEVASSTLGVSYGGFPLQIRSGIPAEQHVGQIVPYVQTVDFYDQLSPCVNMLLLNMLLLNMLLLNMLLLLLFSLCTKASH